MKTSSAIGSYQHLAGDQHLCQFPVLFWGLQIPPQTTIPGEVAHSCTGFWFINLQSLEGPGPRTHVPLFGIYFILLLISLSSNGFPFVFYTLLVSVYSPISPPFSHIPNLFSLWKLSALSDFPDFPSMYFLCYPSPPSSPIMGLCLVFLEL